MATPCVNGCVRQPTPDRLFLTRALTAAVLLTAFIGALFWLDRTQFEILVFAIVALGGYEWARLIRLREGLAVAYGAVCAGIGFATMQAVWPVPWVCGAAGVFWITAVPYLLAGDFSPAPTGTGLGAGIAVLIPAGLAMATLPPGKVLMILGLIWVSDTGAYLSGRAWGRRKLAPSISPGKTWEGVAGGAIGCVIYAIIWVLLDPELRARVQGLIWIPFLAGTLLLCALGVVGDLFESSLKRQAGAKDSGRLLPGHGGVLDRIDSATATLPTALLLMQATGLA